MTRLRIALTSMTILAAGSAALYVLGGVGDSEANAQSPPAPGSPAAPTRAGPPASLPQESGPPMHTITLPATLIAEEMVELHAKASGYISRISVDIGSRVRKGEVLVELDVPEMLDEIRQQEALVAARQARIEAMKAKLSQSRLAIEAALAEQKRVEAELALIRITHERKTQLYREKAIPQQEYDVAVNQLAISEADLAIARAKVEGARGEAQSAEADLKTAEADLGIAQAEAARLRTLLGYTSLRAPFDGVVTRRDVDVGAFVRSATQGSGPPLLKLESVDRLRLVIDVPETHAPLVRTGTAVQIHLRINGQTAINAAISRTAAALRQDTRTLRAEVDLDNRVEELMPGMYARVSIPLPAKKAPGA